MSAPDTPLFLGVDGGATKTRAVVVQADGALRGQGTAGSANQEVVGSRAAVAAVLRAAQEALAAAGGELPCQAAWAGLAGVDHPSDVATFAPLLGSLARHVRVTNDAELLLGALPDGVGVALIAGTGSIALGQNAAGESSRAGGWGHIFGDEGSGYAIGCAALRAVARANDGRGQATALTEAILREWSLDDPAALIACVHQQPNSKARIARLAPVTLAVAVSGDEAARGLLQQEAGALADQALAVAERLALADPLPVALGGGLLAHAAVYRRLVLERLAYARPCAPIVTVTDPALEAALAMRTFGQ